MSGRKKLERDRDIDAEDTDAFLPSSPPVSMPESPAHFDLRQKTVMYMAGLGLCAFTEGFIVALAYLTSLMAVSIIAGLLFLALTIALAIKYRNAIWVPKVWVVGMSFAVFMGIVGGLLAAQSLQLYWRYQSAHYHVHPAFLDNVPEATLGFVTTSYVNSKLVGVIPGQGPGSSLCAAPILAKDPVPPERVYFWAAAVGCCTHTSFGDHAWCAGWDSDAELWGEVIDGSFFQPAAAQSAMKNSFQIAREAAVVTVMTKTEHEDRQRARRLYGLLTLGVIPLLWPLLPCLLRLLSLFLQFSCGVHPS